MKFSPVEFYEERVYSNPFLCLWLPRHGRDFSTRPDQAPREQGDFAMNLWECTLCRMRVGHLKKNLK
ncbi:unnamed protein product [Gulo gulo]|uniref:Uncharacterized protein n=1 Tax=Gulo gulo TaxID=48420 RepID=A0A9X9Q7Q0_GULGU|nr:unnamed protein product [Gulo gulo]